MDLKLETAALKLFAAVTAVDLQIAVVSRSNHRVTAIPPLFVYELLYCEQFVCKKRMIDHRRKIEGKLWRNDLVRAKSAYTILSQGGLTKI